jgi:hypothetical protein
MEKPLALAVLMGATAIFRPASPEILVTPIFWKGQQAPAFMVECKNASGGSRSRLEYFRRTAAFRLDGELIGELDPRRAWRGRRRACPQGFLLHSARGSRRGPQSLSASVWVRLVQRDAVRCAGFRGAARHCLQVLDRLVAGDSVRLGTVEEAACRRTSGCTSRGAELKVFYEPLGVTNVRLAGDPRCSADSAGP